MKRFYLLPIAAFAAVMWMSESFSAESADKTTAPVPLIRAVDFPKVAARAEYFETRINAADPEIRVRVIDELGYFYNIPDEEYVLFLKKMMRDPDMLVRGHAINKLYSMWVPIDPALLPERFFGYHNEQMIDLKDEKCIPELIRQCESKEGPSAGYAAYVLGLLRHKPAVPVLCKLKDHNNIFVQYSAARALIDCGEMKAAFEILDSISATQLGLYSREGKLGGEGKGIGSREPFYAIVASRSLIEIGARERELGLKRLIILLEFFENSNEINNKSNFHYYLRSVLAGVTGKYFLSAKEAKEWLAKEMEKQPKK